MQNVRVVVAESDLNNYPGMYLRKEDGKMKGYWATYPKTIEMGSWGNVITVEMCIRDSRHTVFRPGIRRVQRYR